MYYEIIITTTDFITNKEITEILGIARGSTVRTRNIGRDIFAKLKNIVAATTAMYAAESLGLGTCMLGRVHPLIQNGRNARKFREKHRIKFTSREELFVVFGYSGVE